MRVLSSVHGARGLISVIVSWTGSTSASLGVENKKRFSCVMMPKDICVANNSILIHKQSARIESADLCICSYRNINTNIDWNIGERDGGSPYVLSCSGRIHWRSRKCNEAICGQIAGSRSPVVEEKHPTAKRITGYEIKIFKSNANPSALLHLQGFESGYSALLAGLCNLRRTISTNLSCLGADFRGFSNEEKSISLHCNLIYHSYSLNSSCLHFGNLIGSLSNQVICLLPRSLHFRELGFHESTLTPDQERDDSVNSNSQDSGNEIREKQRSIFGFWWRNLMNHINPILRVALMVLFFGVGLYCAFRCAYSDVWRAFICFFVLTCLFFLAGGAIFYDWLFSLYGR
jgi:hypothetical protein